ncbi:MAG TPA: hypothetical protein DEO32_06170 [Ruminococcaceae bacterium]|nr:hypothetical protein [Oscillospiraceae bacterium]
MPNAFIIKLTAALAACALLLGGCRFSGFAESDMLRPPRTTGDEAEIENLISSAAPGGYTLKYPKSGTHRSAIVTEDLDGDENDEAIAFFREKGSVTGVHMLVMHKDGDSWKVSADFETETADVDSIEFANLDGKNGKQILVGYATLTPNVNFLSCYSYRNGETDVIQTGSPNYSAFYCGSLDNSGKSKVITLTIFSPENEAKATMLEYDREKNRVFSKSSVSMDPNVVKFKNVMFSDLSENVKGIVVDGSSASDETTTQVIYFNKQLDVLRNPLNAEKTGNQTKRSSSVISADTDNDMYVEIPTVSQLPDVSDHEKDIPAEAVTWNKFDTNTEKLVPKREVAVNYGYGYSIRLNDGWPKGGYTALNSSDGKVMTFYRVDKGKTGGRLFEIKVFDIKDWDRANSNEDYTLIYKDTRYAYTFNNFEKEGGFAQTDDQIKTAFSVLNEVAV